MEEEAGRWCRDSTQGAGERRITRVCGTLACCGAGRDHSWVRLSGGGNLLVKETKVQVRRATLWAPVRALAGRSLKVALAQP